MNKTLSLYDVVSDVSQLSGTSEATTEHILQLALSRIAQAVIDGDTTKIRGFGTFRSNLDDGTIKFIFSRKIVDFIRRPGFFEQKYGKNPSDFHFWE